MYRVLDTITIVHSGKEIPTGTVGRLEELSERSRAALLAVGVIAPVAMPPLAILPGWEFRANRLNKVGVINAEQLIDANPDELGAALHMRADTVRKWQAEIMEHLNVM